jgi:hypothetical protein
MTKKNNANSARRKLIPAVGMLVVSAMMLSSSTYAWFTMNKSVQVTNMQVQAKADKGLLINEVEAADSTTWDALATTNQSAGIQLRATSTADTNTWYVGYSTANNNAASATAGAKSANLADGTYYTLGSSEYSTNVQTLQAESAGVSAKQEVTWVDANQNATYDAGEGYYVKYTYYLKSSGEAISLSTEAKNKTLNIKDVAVTGNTATGEGDAAKKAALDKALRVAIVVNDKAYIYAPLYNDAQSYYVNASSSATTTLVGEQSTAMTNIPSVNSDGTPVYVYLYFEGEDANLMTDNITSTLDNLTVSFKFALADNVSAVSDNGVTVSTSSNSEQSGG